MTAWRWFLYGVLVALALTYIAFFTEWLRPAPIGIASQVRFAIQPPRFGRPAKPTQVVQVLHQQPQSNGVPTEPKVQLILKGQQAKAGQSGLRSEVELIGAPEKGTIDQAPGGVSNVTFSLDNWYKLTRIRVEDVPVDGTAPKILWRLVGKSVPLNSLLYGRDPAGMKPLLVGAVAEPLEPGVPYCLIVEAGRRRGTNNFTTVPLRQAE